jgi:hypothetical protein
MSPSCMPSAVLAVLGSEDHNLPPVTSQASSVGLRPLDVFAYGLQTDPPPQLPPEPMAGPPPQPLPPEPMADPPPQLPPEPMAGPPPQPQTCLRRSRGPPASGKKEKEEQAKKRKDKQCKRKDKKEQDKARGTTTRSKQDGTRGTISTAS